MKVFNTSDIHLEHFNDVSNSPLNSSLKTIPIGDILILSGDIWNINFTLPEIYLPFFETVSKNFKYVIYNCGNHEFYHSDYQTTLQLYYDFFNKFDNVIFLHNSDFYIPEFNLNIFGSIMWTDKNNGSHNDERYMNDYTMTYKKQKTSYKNIIEEFELSKKYIIDFLNKHKDDDSNLIITTHHCPIKPDNKPDWIIPSYHTNHFEDFLLNYEKTLCWFYGHSHERKNTKIGNSYFYTNAHGYSFNPYGVNDQAIDFQFIEQQLPF